MKHRTTTRELSWFALIAGTFSEVVECLLTWDF
jgi:hypothetical protein